MRVLLMALLALGPLASSAAEQPVEEFKPTPAQAKDYYDVYTNKDVKYLRVVFEQALAHKEGKEAQEVSPFLDYLSHRFVVISRDPAIYGGTEIYILFQGKTDKMFCAWVYPVGAARTLELRSFKVVNISEEKLAFMRVRYRLFLEDPEHSM